MAITITKTVTYKDADDLAAQIASRLFPMMSDVEHWNDLRLLLCAFAAEIKRSAIES
jgi:hypothetical protein